MINVLDLLQKPKEIETISNFLKENRDLTFREILEKLEKENRLIWFLDCKVSEIFSVKETKIVKQEDIDDVENYKLKVLELLEKTGLGKSKRGLSTKEIVFKIGGNTSHCRKILESLKRERKTWNTGKTQGMKWVLYNFKNEAVDNYLKFG